jgi:hypothetical protein
MRKNAVGFVVLVACAFSCTQAAPAANGAGAGATAVATLAPLSTTLAVAGMASWTATTLGVDMKVHVAGCTTAHEYPVAVYENSECPDAAAKGQVWDVTRGAGIPRLGCDGGSGGTVYYTRNHSDAKPWTIGGSADSNIIGHVVVVQDPDSLKPLACGKITLGEPVAQPEAGVGTGTVAPAALRAQLAGFCISRAIASQVPGCPDPAKFAECSSAHCPLDACVQTCADYLACLAKQPDSCAADEQCPMSAACKDCTTNVTNCTVGPCSSLFACSPPTPGGPCSQLEACCMLQGSRADYCISAVRKSSSFGGDSTCIGLMHDWDFNTNVAFDPHCPFFDAGTGM